MTIKTLPFQFTVCKLRSAGDIPSGREFCFTAVTDEEISLVCRTCDVPEDTAVREDGWRGFRIEGVLDFSLIGILSKISGILAENRIGIFAVSTYNTDYIFVKEENFSRAVGALVKDGFTVGNCENV
ncbi:MAG: ACT domain-containing protein [Lachnospiraceae bacterium]|nr:ACT domain-containing protein [Lachnospiraceae bacterium]